MYGFKKEIFWFLSIWAYFEYLKRITVIRPFLIAIRKTNSAMNAESCSLILSYISSAPAGNLVLNCTATTNKQTLEANLKSAVYQRYPEFLEDWTNVCVHIIHSYFPKDADYWNVDKLYTSVNRITTLEQSKVVGKEIKNGFTFDAESSTASLENDLQPQFRSHALFMVGSAGPLFSSTARTSRLDSRLPDGGIIAKPVALLPTPSVANSQEYTLDKLSPPSTAKPPASVIEFNPSLAKLPTVKYLQSGPFSSIAPYKNSSSSVIPDSSFHSVACYRASSHYKEAPVEKSIDIDIIQNNLSLLEEDSWTSVPIQGELVELNKLLQHLQLLQNQRITSHNVLSDEERQISVQVQNLILKLAKDYDMSPEDFLMDDFTLPLTQYGAFYRGTLPLSAQPLELPSQQLLRSQ